MRDESVNWEVRLVADPVSELRKGECAPGSHLHHLKEATVVIHHEPDSTAGNPRPRVPLGRAGPDLVPPDLTLM